jgi:putative porin
MPGTRFCTASVSALLGLFLLPTSLQAQNEVARAGVKGNLPVVDKPVDKPSDLDHRVEALEERLREQSEKLDKLMVLVAEQQRVIAKLTSNDGEAGTPTRPTEVVSATADSAPTSRGSKPSVEEQIKKLDEQVQRIGPFRFSGDFRLRFDGIFRGAEPNPPAGFAPLTHQQNARLRYRLRFNFDTDINSKVSFHGQLATGPINNAVTTDQDFTSVTTRHPFFISEAWIDYHPNKSTELQGGRVLEIFADNSRFLFDDDIRFNGFNEKYVWAFKNNGLKASSLEFRAGQYILSNPNVAIVTAGSPLALDGDKVGSTGRAANLFHQGLLVNQKFNDRWSSQAGGDVQIYRNPNQIQLASTAVGLPLIVQNGLGLTLSGPVTGTGNATTTNGGAIYTAHNFQIARVTYRLNWAGWKSGSHAFPVVFNIQAARNIGIGLPERDAMLASFQVGHVENHGDVSFLYVFSSKGANSMISQVTDDDLGTNTGVNIETHHLRFDYGIAKKITWQTLFYIQSERRSTGDFPNFFVPLNAFTPRQYRFQEQILFRF